MSFINQKKGKNKVEDRIQNTSPSHNLTVVDRNQISVRCGELISISTPSTTVDNSAKSLVI